MDGESRHEESLRVVTALIAVAMLFVSAGFAIAFLRLSADKGGYLAGQGLVYGVLAWVVLGLILKSVHASYAWSAAFCLAAFLFMFGLLWFSDVGQVRDQQKATQAALVAMITRLGSETKMPAMLYAESDYGKYAPFLDSLDRDLRAIQQQRFAMEAKEQTAGKLDLDTTDTFVIEADRTAEYHKIEVLREVNTETLRLTQQLLDTVHADVQSSPMDAQEKHDFIQTFDKSALPRKAQIETVTKLGLQLDDIYDDMLDTASQDHPLVTDSHLVFHGHAALLRFQADGTKAKPLVAELREARARLLQDRASDLKALTAPND